MFLKRHLDDSSSSKSNWTIVRVNRRRKIDTDLEEGEAITNLDALNNKYEATANPPYLVYLYDTRSDQNIGNYHPLMLF